MNYTINMSRKERIFLDSSIIIGLFSGEDDVEKILGKIATFDPDFKRVDFLEMITPE
jgi:hypothetical protein